MASSMLTKVTCLAMICLVLSIPLANSAPSCPEVQQTLAPCGPYLIQPGPPPPPEPCCNGVKTLNDQARTQQDRRDVCGCLKSIVANPKLNLPAVASLPKDCGVDIGYVISPDMDCSKVN
ncbi:putative plant lipid transfer protein/Par allergen [Medicago truncatula]|uniref:Non-specific lipid-transfer protein n=1 Tax=Medicago truncatula TaxID=3880 RepID=A0A072VS85_MEDTR|nr:non-specific lipid-transfer protein [Medicago truncatula]KEH40980.1 Lipid transfer protein [Medicago truncatula]RHN78454.1 putative plant lipid transfer protein/Par allergen [Medicago truncatula]